MLREAGGAARGDGGFDGAGLADGARFDDAAEARACVEGRFLSMRGRGAALGLGAPPRRVLAVGGASRNAAIAQVARRRRARSRRRRAPAPSGVLRI